MLSIFSVYRKYLFLSLFLFVFISVLILNLFSVLDFNNKINLTNNICKKFTQNPNVLNYTLKRLPINKHNYNNDINNYLNNGHNSNDNGFETSFTNISDNIFIYSAFETTNNMIVMIGLAKNCKQIDLDYNYYNYNNSYKVEDHHYFCAFGHGIKLKTSAVVSYLPESHDHYYSAIKVECKRPKLYEQNLSINRVKLIQRPKPLDKSNKTDPNNKSIESELIKITANNRKSINNSNYGLDSDQESNRSAGSHRTPDPLLYATPKQLVVCVRPLYGNISAINLLEFITYYRLQGIDRIVFYNSLSPRLMSNRNKQLFQLLSAIDSVQVLPFIIPNNNESQPIIHAFGQLAAIHDCLYRFANYKQIHLDFDEYLMPFNNRSIKEFVSSNEISRSTAVIVPTVLFCNEFKDELAKGGDPLLITNYNRQKTVWPHEIRSKVIIMRAPLISQMGIHNVWQLSPYYRRQKSHPIMYSKPNEILVYHYRKCCDMTQPYFANLIHFHPINDYIIRDESMKRFLNRVKQFIDKYIEFY